MKKLLLLFFALSLTATGYAQTTVAGVKVPATMKVNGEELILNGAGLREKYFIDLYVGALFTTAKESDAEALVNSGEPMAISLKIIDDLVTQDKMIESVEDGFMNSVPSRKERKKLQDRIDEFIGFFNEPIVNGDQFVLATNREGDTVVFKNSKKLGEIKGADFSKALMNIWLGEDPADDDLKDGLLGK
jgi:hypothetical protein